MSDYIAARSGRVDDPDAIGQAILLNPRWIELELSCATRSYERLQRELPTQRRAVENALADVNRRIAKLVANCEAQVVPELDERMRELRTEREQLQTDLNLLLADGEQHKGPPTREWIEAKLGELRSVLVGRGPAAAHALRALVGGKIVVTEIRRPGRKRHYLRGRLELRLRSVADAIGTTLDDDQPGALPPPTEIIELDFREPERFEQMADEAKALWDDGLTEKQIGSKLGCSRALVSRALDHWYARRQLTRPDGRSCRKRRKVDRREARLGQVMDLWHKDLSVGEIAEKCDCCLETVRTLVVKWHEERCLPVPDGRARRREIRLKRRTAG